MAKARQASGGPISTLDREILNQENRLKELYALREQQQEIERQLSRMLNGHATVAKSKPGPKAAGRGGKRRTRKPGVTNEWLTKTLKTPMTVKQLQEAAGKAGLSGLRIPVLLREGKFKSSAGEKQEGQKGKAAAVWGVK